MKVKLSKDAEKRLDRLPKLSYLGNNPFLGKKLTGEFEGLFSLKVWPYRVIYQINKLQRVITIVTVEYRQGVYK